MGPGAARDIVFSARMIPADEAYAIGLVQRVVPDGTLTETVTEYARTVAANAPLTVKGMKLIVNEVLKPDGERDLAACQELVDACFASEDYTEGRTAFMEKRPPAFKGR